MEALGAAIWTYKFSFSIISIQSAALPTPTIVHSSVIEKVRSLFELNKYTVMFGH